MHLVDKARLVLLRASGTCKESILQWIEKGSNNCLGEGSSTGLNDSTCYGQSSGLGDRNDLGAITQDLVDEFEPFWGDEAMTENEVDISNDEDDSLDSDYIGGTKIFPIVDVDVEVEVDEVALNLSDKDTCSDDSDHVSVMNKQLRKRKSGGRLIQKPSGLLRAPSYSRKAHGGHLSVTTYKGSANDDGKISPVDVGEDDILGLWDYEWFLLIIIVSESGGNGGRGRETRRR
ncbi:hypothetical protein L6452_22463 [Arctium lappa]|uniref:Uncharacterized protein n=1 Tax=Arctium lappa TaxID=4217 RepID=A0ACB9B471_ARCLA|nr:hypothetical protein L6452_22463 [Arctium lappa]